MIAASDELRHRANDARRWRESVYFIFADAENQIGGWFYLWVRPNMPKKSGMLVCFYHGVNQDDDVLRLACEAPDHMFRGDDGSWVYCNYVNIEELAEADFDDIEINGLHLRRRGELYGYEIDYDDGIGTSAQISYTFTTLPWDYRDGRDPCPEWLAENRYHRSGVALGKVTVAGADYDVSATGDADHSWGERDNRAMGEGHFKYWAIQDPGEAMTCSVIHLGHPGDERALGFLNIDGRMESVVEIEDSVGFGPGAVQRDVEMTVTDAAGRRVTASMETPFAAVNVGVVPGWSWGYEAVGQYDVEGYGPCCGLVSYFWPADTTAGDLVARASR